MDTSLSWAKEGGGGACSAVYWSVGSSRGTLLAANCWKYGEGVDVFHNNGRPIDLPPALCGSAIHSRRTCAYSSMDRRL